MERVPGAFITATILTSTLAVAGGPETHDRQRVEMEAQYRVAAAADTRCGAIAVGSSVVRPEDAASLPPLPLGTYQAATVNDILVTYEYRGGQLHASYLTVDKDRLHKAIGDVQLPRPQAKAFAAALDDSYVQCILMQHVTALNVRATSESDAGSYSSSNNNIDIRLTERVGSEDRIYETDASIRSVLAHEGTHGVVAGWRQKAKQGDQQTMQLLNELNGLYTEELAIVAEDFRLARGEEVVRSLEVLARAYDGQKYQNTVKAIEYVRRALQSPHGLDHLVVQNVSEIPGVAEYERRTIRSMIYQAGRLSGHEIEKDAFGQEAYGGVGESTPPPVNLDPLYEADQAYGDFADTAYPANDESLILHDIQGKLSGHPYDGTDEMIADTVASAQLASDRMVCAMNTLSPERRGLEARQQHVILQLYLHNDPHLLRYMNLPKIVR